MRVAAIVQARTGSTRLPGKVLKDLGGRTVLERVIQRVAGSHSVDEIIVATSRLPEDDPIAELVEGTGLRVYRGSPTDVLSRYAMVVRELHPEIVVRITADCPLIDGDVIDRVVMRLDEGTDMASNAIIRSWPKGLDVEAVWADVIMRLDRMAMTPQAREHVLWAAYRDDLRHLFRCVSVLTAQDDSDLSWTVDTKADLDHMRLLWEDKPYQALVEKDRNLGVLR